MTRQGDFVVTAVLLLSAALIVMGAVLLALGRAPWALFLGVAACYSVLLAVFLEVYSRRG